MLKLAGVPRDYAWGGDRYIADLLGIDRRGPIAEYWLGAHPAAPSAIVKPDDASGLPSDLPSDLRTLLTAYGSAWMGGAWKTWGELPFLLKILDVARPLSIQVHPSKSQAEAGYADEDRRGIALDDPRRNFKDRNHKPEMAVALGQGSLLYGFRPTGQVLALLPNDPRLEDLSAAVARGEAEAFSCLMHAASSQLERWTAALLDWAERSPAAPATDPRFWLNWWRRNTASEKLVDRGVPAFVLLNLLRLDDGEAVFLPANLPHAYLSGVLIEVMANSDNVLRCGLTPKHIDPAGVLAHVRFDSVPQRIVPPDMNGVRDYGRPSPEFRLRSVGPGSHRIDVEHVGIALVMGGSATIVQGGESLALGRGEAALLQGGEARFDASEDGRTYLASA